MAVGLLPRLEFDPGEDSPRVELGWPLEQEAVLEVELAAWALEQEALAGLELPLGLVLVEEWAQTVQADALEFLLMIPLSLLLLPNWMVLAWVVEASVVVSPDLKWGC